MGFYWRSNLIHNSKVGHLLVEVQSWPMCLSIFFLISTWLHLSCFAVINYLYAHSLPSLIDTGRAYGLLFTVAVVSHILLSDRFSVIHHPKRFLQRNRWIGSASLVLGLLNKFLLLPLSDLMLAFATAFLGGGLLMTVFREEFPAANSTRLLWFPAGSGGMVILLIIPMLKHAEGRYSDVDADAHV